MASKKLNYDQIAERKLLDPLIKEIEKVNDLLQVTEKALKDTANQAVKMSKQDPLKPYENLKKTEEAIDKVNKATKDLDNLEKERIKLQQKQIELEDERAKGNARLREEIKEQAKALREQAKEALQANNAYKDLTKRVNAAQAEFKRLAAEFGVNSTQAKIALKTFNDLDDQLREINKTAKDGRRDVGRYSDAIEDTEKSVKSLGEKLDDTKKDVKSLGEAFKTLGIVTVILQAFDLMKDAFTSNSESAGDLQKIYEKLTISIAVFVNRASKLLPALELGFDKMLASMKLGFAELTNVFGNNEEEIKKYKKEIEELNKKQIPSITETFAGMTEEIEKLIKVNDQLIDNTIKYRKEIVDLEKDIADLRKTQAEQQVQADDTTRSLEDQAKAQEQLNITNDKLLSLEIEIAQKRFELANDNAKVNKFSIEAQEELAEAVSNLAEKEAEQIQLKAEGQRALREIERDALERRLDFLIDDFDNQKTVNERIIASEKETLERRRAILEDTQTLAEASFKKQQEELNKNLDEQGKATLDFEELQKMTSSEAIARKIQESGLDDILAGRALEIIRERRTANQDLKEALQDVTDSEKEAQEIKSETLLTQQALNELEKEGVDLQLVLSNLEEKRLQNAINNLEKRLELAKEGSKEYLEIENELSQKLLEQQTNRQDKQVENDEEFYSTSFSALKQFTDKITDATLNSIDKDLEANQDRQESLKRLAEEGDETAEQNLANTQKRQAELEREREAAVKKQKRFELGLAAIQSYSSAVENGEKNPLAKTISDISVLTAFIDNLPGFFHGTENTGTEGLLSDQYGKITGFTHENERVLTADQNKMVGNISNMELAMLAQNSKNSNKSSEVFDNNKILEGLNRVESAIKSQRELIGTEYDGKIESVISTFKKQGKIERKHESKKGGLWN